MTIKKNLGIIKTSSGQGLDRNSTAVSPKVDDMKDFCPMCKRRVRVDHMTLKIKRKNGEIEKNVFKCHKCGYKLNPPKGKH